MKNLLPVDKITHVDELLAYDGSEFVDVAYRVLLRRNADVQGRAHYLERLQHGDGKDGIVYALYTSAEFRRSHHKPEITGLDRLVECWARRRKARGFIASLQGLQKSLGDLRHLERRVNQLEFQIADSPALSERIAAHGFQAANSTSAESVTVSASRPAEPTHVFEVRHGKCALLTLLNFEAAVRASPMANAFAR